MGKRGIKRLNTSGIINVSCGIGRSFDEAANAVAEAKKHKKRMYNIEVYAGKRLRSKIPISFKRKIKNYIKFSDTLKENQKKMLESITLHDPVTGLLNKTGFFLNLERLRRIKISQGYYMLLDLDDLHYWNKKLGYSEVDKRLGKIGRSVLMNIRHSKDRAADILGHRLNESAGDEFLIFFPSKHTKENLEIFKEKAESIIWDMRKAQKR